MNTNTDNRLEDFDQDEWGNLGEDDILDPAWKRKKSSASKFRISQSKATLDKQTALDIWDQVWGPDRSVSLYTKLAKKYNCADDAARSIANGHHFHLNITKEQYKEKLDNWYKTYGYKQKKYILRSPGNDLLDYYDEIHHSRPETDRPFITPSELFDIRFRSEATTLEEQITLIAEKLTSKNVHLQYEYHSVFICLCKRYATDVYSWLVDQPHIEHVTDNLPDMSKLICELSGRKFKGGGGIAFDYIKKRLCLYSRAKSLPGYSLVVEE